jgi:hypothetical protein
MLPFGVTIPATVPQRSEISEGLTNYPVYEHISDHFYWNDIGVPGWKILETERCRMHAEVISDCFALFCMSLWAFV